MPNRRPYIVGQRFCILICNFIMKLPFAYNVLVGGGVNRSVGVNIDYRSGRNSVKTQPDIGIQHHLHRIGNALNCVQYHILLPLLRSLLRETLLKKDLGKNLSSERFAPVDLRSKGSKLRF